jgi:NAD(P)-dependent dehydrogenase (short-subunit alcohol dehydrogenase family)
MPRDNRRETVVITGASGGLGRAVARAFGRRGANVGLLARGIEGLQAAAREVMREGGAALVLPTDVADAGSVEHAAAAIEERFGPIDIWINNAMATIFSPFADLTPDEYRRATEVSYLGYVYGTMAALRRMRPRDRGTIVQVGSALAYRAIPLQSPYCGARFAVRGFTDSIRSELIHDNSRVRITMVQMPALNTPQFDWSRNKTGRRAQPVPPIFQPELGAEAVVFAAHAGRREVWVGKSSWQAIVASKLAPGLIDRYLARAGYDGQLAGEPLPPGAPDNLYRPAPGDFGAHGRFDEQARRWSTQFWLTRHRGSLLAGAGLMAAAALVWLSPGGRRLAHDLFRPDHPDPSSRITSGDGHGVAG